MAVLKYNLPTEVKDLGVRFFEIDKSGKIVNGGLISLDGILRVVFRGG